VVDIYYKIMQKILRIIKFGIQGFFRNFWLSLVSITMMLMALFSVTLLIGIDYTKEAAIAGVNKKVDILVSLKKEVIKEDLEILVNNLNSLEEVKKVSIITPEENKELYEQSGLGLKSKEALNIFSEEDNPFSYSLAIQAYQLNQYQVILDFVQEEEYSNIVEYSDFHDFDQFIASIDNFANGLNKYSWYITLFFGLISLVVIFNTIRISIYTRKNEVMIMKLVGASNSFVRAPFVLEGVFYALISVLVLIALVYPLVNIIQPSITNYFQDNHVINIAGYFKDNFFNIFGLQFLALAVLNIFSTIIAMRKYLKV